jgi:hypothetical protein
MFTNEKKLSDVVDCVIGLYNEKLDELPEHIRINIIKEFDSIRDRYNSFKYTDYTFDEFIYDDIREDPESFKKDYEYTFSIILVLYSHE